MFNIAEFAQSVQGLSNWEISWNLVMQLKVPLAIFLLFIYVPAFIFAMWAEVDVASKEFWLIWICPFLIAIFFVIFGFPLSITYLT